MFRGVIFDFDGTLVRSHHQVYGVLQELSSEYGFPLPTAEQLREMSTLEAANAMGIRIWQIPRFTVLARNKLRRAAGEIQFEPGMLSLLSDLKQMGVKTGLVTSNSPQVVATVLARHSADSLFQTVMAGSSFLGKHRKLLGAVKHFQLPLEQVLYVGDETRDIEACHKAGVASAAVHWGFHSAKKLEALNPNFSIATVEDLRRVF